VCIRPNLPPYTTSAETATFVLGGALAQATTLKLWKVRDS
jgi:hypothetical protein